MRAFNYSSKAASTLALKNFFKRGLNYSNRCIWHAPVSSATRNSFKTPTLNTLPGFQLRCNVLHVNSYQYLFRAPYSFFISTACMVHNSLRYLASVLANKSSLFSSITNKILHSLIYVRYPHSYFTCKPPR